MNTVFQCVVLLPCIICTSTSILKCRCIKVSSNGVRLSLIADVQVYKPRPYCSKEEVIVIMKDNKSLCLDPKQTFTQAVVQTMQKLRALKASKAIANQKTKSATVSTILSTVLSATAEPTLESTLEPTSS